MTQVPDEERRGSVASPLMGGHKARCYGVSRIPSGGPSCTPNSTGLVVHLYGLPESEFAHILNTFPLVPDPVKVAAQNAYRDGLCCMNNLAPT
jgi:hypothetical protein